MEKAAFFLFACLLFFVPKAQILAAEPAPEQNLSQYLPNGEEVIFIVKYIPERMLRIFEQIFPMDPASWRKHFNWLKDEGKDWQPGLDTGKIAPAAENSKKSGESQAQNQPPAKKPGLIQKMYNLIYGQVEDIANQIYGILKK
ncbi:MAG: hypothetical protein PHQ47_03090 [Candidatus Portnoybacteria bacterium]|nr:hypothetical protein [Candidatus Portnoybacteria bacterium]